MSTKQDSLDQARPTFLNVKEVAELLRIKTRTVYEMVSFSDYSNRWVSAQTGRCKTVKPFLTNVRGLVMDARSRAFVS